MIGWMASCAVLQGFVEALVGDELGGAFDHHHFGFGTDVDEVEVGIEHFVVVRVGDELTVDLADADTADRSVPGHIGDQHGSGCGVDHEDIWLVDAVGGEEETDDLNFVHEALREERTKWTVAKT